MRPEQQLMKAERQKASFDVEELTNWLDGGKDITQRRRQFEKIFQSDPNLKIPNVSDMTREERFLNSVKRSVYLTKKFFQKNSWEMASPEGVMVTRAGISEYSFALHFGVFLPCIYNFGSKEQIEKWAPLAENLEVIGAYAQTELGHGSNLRGLETTATYDASSEEFIINSPSITAAKWWPGDMGLLGNHVILMSRLIIGGRDLGMHPFMVQTRDLKTHQSLPGIEVGDLGSKMGFEVIDNGYMLFNNVKIPRENLLCKNAEVLRDGSYVKHADGKMMYISMTKVRVSLLRNPILSKLGKACTIATRYSAVRRQGHSSTIEPVILDYLIHQHKILPQIARVFAIDFCSKKLMKFQDTNIDDMQNGDLSKLAELHSLSSCIKALSSEEAVKSCEILRRSCGGQGYLNASGLPRLYLNLLPSCTYEGENTLLYLQCSRYLLKSFTSKNSNDDSVAYLFNQNNNFYLKEENCLQIESLLLAFQKRSRANVQRSVSKFNHLISTGLSPIKAAESLSIELTSAARAHGFTYMLTAFIENCHEPSFSSQLRHVMTSLCLLFALHHVNENQGEFIQFRAMKESSCDHFLEAEKELLMKLRPNAIPLVDALDYGDESLQSCIGCYDGEVYERLLQAARQSRLNKNKVHLKSFKIIQESLNKEVSKL